ncbi:MAG: threonine synthase [Rhodothermales bacterium]|nr:threonine synthase [Rhodothermales bacterium]
MALDDYPSGWPEAAASSPEFLIPFWPISSAEHFPPFPVGDTPLLAAPELRRVLGTPNLQIKDDTRNPSGSTKDRASFLVVAKAKEYGFKTVATASTGNAATALAAVAAASGIRAVVFVPASAPRAKLVQMLAHGAAVMPVDGTYDEAFELCCAACEEFGWYNRNTALNPFTIEGKKTVALEIARQMTPDAPDVVVVPTGDGVILSGIAKGFHDLVRGGLIARPPRLIAVQPDGSDSLARALITGSESITPVPGANSVADSLTVEAPRNAIQCLRAVRASGGGGVVVSDGEIVDGIAELAQHTGVFAEPAGAAVLPGLRSALQSGLIERRERIVLLVTGTGLKDVASAARAVAEPSPIKPKLADVAQRWREFATG